MYFQSSAFVTAFLKDDYRHLVDKHEHCCCYRNLSRVVGGRFFSG